MRYCLITLCALLSLAPLTSATATSWSRIQKPSLSPAQAIGEYAAGCLAGAQQLPLQGEGFQIMRPSRNRFYAHPRTADFLRQMGRDLQAQGLGQTLVGDISQPRGGPAPSGHRSHQIGLDADIWLARLLDGKKLGRQGSEKLSATSMVLPDLTINRAAWGMAQVAQLRYAASHPDVDRIFVHPAIKRELCDVAPDADWLQKVRPWYGHDAHMHVRLKCPSDSTACIPQAPLPEGTGCDASLNWWGSPEARTPAPAQVAPAPVLPAQCALILKQ